MESKPYHVEPWANTYKVCGPTIFFMRDANRLKADIFCAQLNKAYAAGYERGRLDQVDLCEAHSKPAIYCLQCLNSALVGAASKLGSPAPSEPS